MKSLLRPNIRALTPYSTARDDCKAARRPDVFIDANESPYDNGVNRYPDPRHRQLKAAVARLKGVPPECVFAGNGSDEPIDLLFRLFCRPGIDNALTVVPTYGMYAVAAAVNDVQLREVPLLPADFGLPAERLLAAADDCTKLLFVCSPNNPTGNAFTPQSLERLARGFGGILVIDEAYIDFSSQPSMLPLLQRYDRLVVLQTLSKAWGMAGLRLGLAFASKELVAYLDRVKYPYNLNVLTQQEAVRRLGSEPLATRVAEIKAERARLAARLPEVRGVVKVYPSDANFLLVKFAPGSADSVYERLIACGIIVRNRSRQPLCADCLRLTIGTPAENDALLAALAAPGAR